MPTYICPECSEKIKRAQPVEAGKKLKCPECATVFAVKSGKAPEAKKSAAAPAPVRPKSRWDDEGPANYELAKDETDAGTGGSQEEREKAYGPLKERFEKGKRGPALPLVVKPSNFLLMVGVCMCVMGITTDIVSTWDMIFKREVVEEKGKKSIYDTGSKKTKYVELTADEYRAHWIWFAGGVAYFLWGSVVCAGASKMHEVQTYWLALVGSAMSFIGPLAPLGILFGMWTFESAEPDMGWGGPAVICFMPGIFICGWCIHTLLQEKVKAGFADDSEIT